jgi:ATP-binding cassette subfamily F protein 3
MGFTNRVLFKDVSFSIFPKEKIGLTGPNGAGKTTLFSIILGEQESVSGNVTVQKNINIGFLPQEVHFDSKRTVMEEITSGDERIRSLVDEKHKLEDENKADTDRYGDIMHELEQMGIYELEHRAEKILMGLGFKEADFHRPIVELSGGWRMRTLLAKLLTYPYDLLFLDEPTNHLDLNATLWLKDFLKNYPGAFLLISHDRVFLNEVTNYTIILEHGKMTKVKGSYQEYEEQKEIQLKHLERQSKVVEKKRDQLERFAERFHAQPNKASAVRNKRKQLEKLDEIEIPTAQHSKMDFEFDQIPASGYVVVRGEQLAKSYGDKKVYQGLDFEITKGQKVCLVGPNGAGKSTLLKMLSGAIPPDSGQVKYGHNVTHGYFSQTRMDVLQADRTAMEEVYASAPGGTQTLRIRSLLGLFSFHGDDVFKPVRVLSGGEKSRLILAKLLINPPNFMLLDEPTTHLDLDGVKALTAAFQKFEGTVCFISHDLYFIKQIADTIGEVDSGQIRVYPGGLDYYLDKRKEKDALLKEQKRQEKKEQDVKKQTAHHEENAHLRALQEQHNSAKKRLIQIKEDIKKLERETQDLETESYVKSRALSNLYESKDGEKIKEFGQRLKYIQSRQREIESTIKALKEERDRTAK